MRPLNLLAALLVATAAGVTDARAFSLSSVSSLLSRVGVNVTLPDVTIDLSDRAEAAIDRALTRAESVLDDVLDGREIDVDQIVSDALDRAQARIDAARERAQERIDAALARARSVLDSIDLPEVDLPNLDLDNLDLQEIVDSALNRAQSAVDRGLDRAQEALDRVEGVLDGLLDDEPVVSSLLSELPPVAVQALQSAGLSQSYAVFAATAVEPAALGVPEPMTLALVAPLLAGLAGRRHR